MLMQTDKARIMLVGFALGIGVCMRVTMGFGKIGVAVALLCWGFSAGAEAPSKTQAEKVLRYAFEIAETGFDPAQISDYYSSTATVGSTPHTDGASLARGVPVGRGI